jgi:hypothetical protein
MNKDDPLKKTGEENRLGSKGENGQYYSKNDPPPPPYPMNNYISQDLNADNAQNNMRKAHSSVQNSMTNNDEYQSMAIRQKTQSLHSAGYNPYAQQANPQHSINNNLHPDYASSNI